MYQIVGKNRGKKQKKVLIWFHGLDDFLSCKSGFHVAGMFVQLACWAQILIKEGYNISSLTNGKSCKKGDIKYYHWTIVSKIEVLHEFFGIPLVLLKEHPRIVIFNGADRILFSLAFWCKVFKIKLVFIAASDMDFSTSIGFIAGKAYNTHLYWHTLKKGKMHFVVQNQRQQADLKGYFGRNSIIIPNVWTKIKFNIHEEKSIPAFDIVWVANIKPLKRPHWAIEIAKRLPDYSFAMAGNCACDEDEYNEFLKGVHVTDNLDYLGGISFDDASDLIAKSKLLLCTSEFEGLPNTFLQAWQANVPIVSTVNPNNVFTQHGVGSYVTSIEEIVSALHDILNDKMLMQTLKKNVNLYYQNTYNTCSNLSLFQRIF